MITVTFDELEVLSHAEMRELCGSNVLGSRFESVGTGMIDGKAHHIFFEKDYGSLAAVPVAYSYSEALEWAHYHFLHETSKVGSEAYRLMMDALEEMDPREFTGDELEELFWKFRQEYLDNSLEV